MVVRPGLEPGLHGLRAQLLAYYEERTELFRDKINILVYKEYRSCADQDWQNNWPKAKGNPKILVGIITLKLKTNCTC